MKIGTSYRLISLFSDRKTLKKHYIYTTTMHYKLPVNTHTTELQLIKIHIGKTKHITVANTYFPPRDIAHHISIPWTQTSHTAYDTSPTYQTQYSGEVNAHSTLWYSHTDDHRGQLISDITLQQATSPDITTISTTLYNRTTWHTIHALNSDHLPIITNYRKANWTQFTTDTDAAFLDIQPSPDIHTANTIFTNIILHAGKHNIPKGKIHFTCKLLPEYIRAQNASDPSISRIKL